MLGKDYFVTVVEDNDSGEIFVRVRNFEQIKRLSSVIMFVRGAMFSQTVNSLYTVALYLAFRLFTRCLNEIKRSKRLCTLKKIHIIIYVHVKNQVF